MHKLNLKAGDNVVEIESESPIDLDYVENLFAIVSRHSTGLPREGVNKAKTAASEEHAPTDLNINQVCTKLNASSCRDVLIAAALVEYFKSDNQIFSRTDWEQTAASAIRWKKDYAKQRSTNVNRLIDAGHVYERSGNMFTLAPDFAEELGAKLDI